MIGYNNILRPVHDPPAQNLGVANPNAPRIDAYVPTYSYSLKFAHISGFIWDSTLLAPYSTAHTVQNPFPFMQLSCWAFPNLPEIFLHSGLLFILEGLLVLQLSVLWLFLACTVLLPTPGPLAMLVLDLELSSTVSAP